MKKKFFIAILAVCVFFGSVSNVWAQDVTFSDIKARYIELINDSNYNITETDDKVKVSLTNPTYGDYSIEFNYNDNVISYINNRDVSSSSDEVKIYYTFTDTYFISALIYALFDVYDINDEAFDEYEIDNDAMGIIWDTEDEIHYETSDGAEATYSPIKSFSVDLALFDNYTKAVQNSNRDKNVTTQTINFFKLFMDPMTDNITRIDLLEDFEEAIDDMFSDDSLMEEIVKENNNQDTNSQITQTVNVPSTGINSLYVLIGAALISLIIGVLTYIIMIKKKI